MRPALFLFIWISLTSCTKDQDGKYCPALEESTDKGHLLDLNTIAHLGPVLDTLAKYPQLRAIEKRESTAKTYQGDITTTKVFCRVYYRGVPLSRQYIMIMHGSGRMTTSGVVPSDPGIPVQPEIDRAEAEAYAKKKVDFLACPVSLLALTDISFDTIPKYKLTWRFRDSELSARYVEFDANTGEVYTIYNQ